MKKRVVLVSGMSGAGKTSATSVLEDMGYHCIDQFPVQLLSLLVDMIESSTDPRYHYTAISTSAKDFPEFIKAFSGADMDVRVLFLDASNEKLLHRYKLTRYSASAPRYSFDEIPTEIPFSDGPRNFFPLKSFISRYPFLRSHPVICLPRRRCISGSLACSLMI